MTKAQAWVRKSAQPIAQCVTPQLRMLDLSCLKQAPAARQWYADMLYGLHITIVTNLGSLHAACGQ